MADQTADIGECLWANQICEQPNHHGCLTCTVAEPQRPTPPASAPVMDEVDEEQFCPSCFAGMESSEHHEKCVRPAESDWDDLPCGFDMGEGDTCLLPLQHDGSHS